MNDNISNALSKIATECVIEASKRDLRFLHRKQWSAVGNYFAKEEDEERTKVRCIFVDVKFTNSMEKNFNWKFNPGDVTNCGDDAFTIGLHINMELPFDELSGQHAGLTLAISENLHHLFKFVDNVEKKSERTNERNKRLELKSISDYGVRTLREAIYLTDPTEIEMRMQDIQEIIAQLESQKADDALDELLLYRPFRDLANLNRMKFNKIEITDAVRDFVHQMGEGDAKEFIATLDKTRGSEAHKALWRAYGLLCDRYKVGDEVLFQSGACHYIYNYQCSGGGGG